MKSGNSFIALGGAQSVGASSYFVKIDNRSFLFDCGRGISDGITLGPNMGVLLQEECINSLSQLDQIFISHGHFDHVGYLPDLLAMNAISSVIASPTTKELGKYLMSDGSEKQLQGLSDDKRQIYNQRLQGAFAKVQTIPLNITQQFEDYQVTLFEAGHIPGAVMTFVETSTKKILYTGDFLTNPTLLTKGYCLPKGVKPDLLVLCGLHAMHPQYQPVRIENISVSYMSICLQKKQSVFLSIKQLTKGLEVIQLLNMRMEKGLIPEARIYVDSVLWRIADSFSIVGQSVLTQRCHRIQEKNIDKNLGIYIGTGKMEEYFAHVIKFDFSLHASYSDIVKLIKDTIPSQVMVVHTGSPRNDDNSALISEFCDIEIKFCKSENRYSI